MITDTSCVLGMTTTVRKPSAYSVYVMFVWGITTEKPTRMMKHVAVHLPFVCVAYSRVEAPPKATVDHLW